MAKCWGNPEQMIAKGAVLDLSNCFLVISYDTEEENKDEAGTEAVEN
jgi:hypothetical protein